MKTLSNLEKRFELLRENQSQLDKLEAKFLKQRAKLEAKYKKLYEPLYTTRFEVVNGVKKVESAENKSKDSEHADVQDDEEEGIPDFWLTAMKANVVPAEEIQEHDEAALKHLKDIKWRKIDGLIGFQLEFFFKPNPFFKNSVLTKTYHLVDKNETVLRKAIGTVIEWLPGKCLTIRKIKKIPKKGAKNAKPVIVTRECSSFFNFFNPPLIPENDEYINETTLEELQDQLERDYDVGLWIRDRIIHHAFSWFTGEVGQNYKTECTNYKNEWTEEDVEDSDKDENEDDEDGDKDDDVDYDEDEDYDEGDDDDDGDDEDGEETKPI